MSTKRKQDDRKDEDESEAKRQRVRPGSSDTEQSEDDDGLHEKREALWRLFGRTSSADLGNDNPEQEQCNNEDCEEFADENDDPLLEAVPEDMDPEQLGFLVCAQETLRFLQMRGLPVEHPMLANLRSRFLRGIIEMGLA